MPCTLRLISWTPTSYSRSRIWRLSEGCAVCSLFSAASVRLPSSATAMKYRRCHSSISAFHISKACHPAYKVFFADARGSYLARKEAPLGRHPWPPCRLPGVAVHAPPAEAPNRKEPEHEQPSRVDHRR